MDYGTLIKRVEGNANRRSKNYTRQSAFIGSDRSIRGEIIRRLVQADTLLYQAMIEGILCPSEQLMRVIEALIDEGMIIRDGSLFSIARASHI
jgi:hypothetical protein